MLDIRYIRENPDKVQQNAKDKGYNVSISDLLTLDEERRSLQLQVDELRGRKNEIAKKPYVLDDDTKFQERMNEGKRVKVELAEREEYLRATTEKFQNLLDQVPNITKDDVPVGDEEDSVEIKKWGEQKTGAKDHLDFALERGWVDFERGAKVAGAKFYFLKNELAELEVALLQYGMSIVRKHGFEFMTVPHMVNSRTAVGTGFAPRTSEQSDEYAIEGEDLSLIATAEMPLTGYHADEILDAKDLPKLYAGYSPSYRKEAGAAGKHTRGLFRVHQFNKLEMYAFTLPEQSEEVHEKLREIEEEIWQNLEIPYHIINIASGDLGAPAAKKYDLEYWSAVDGSYRELTSCSNCTDFQARNLNIRVRRENGDIDVVHTLNGTAISMARSLIAIIEHHQNEDGTLKVPEVLRPYIGGRDQL